MYQFSKSAPYKKLKELAKSPPDLTEPGFLSNQRIKDFSAETKLESDNLILNFAAERISEPILEELFNLAKSADCLKKMDEMQSGAVLNKIIGFPSESRPVLHTATRDFFANKNNAPSAKEAADFSKKELDKLQSFIEVTVEKRKFKNLILIGIGGSELGPKANYEALRAYNLPERQVFFLANVDPDDAADILGQCELDKTLVLVISKSGDTLETATNEAFVKSKMAALGLNPKEHFVAITSPKSKMDDREKYLEVFYLLDSVGGRYSSTSMVGGVLLAFALGFPQFMEFLRGANAMDKHALTEDPKKNLPLLAALVGIWNRNFLNHPILAIIPYSHALARFSSHIQQLDMESNGKHIDIFGHLVDFETGPIIFGEPGTNSQHSFYQLIHQGTTIVPIEFIGFKKNQRGEDIEFLKTNSQEKLLANLFAQIISLATGEKSENPNKAFLGNRPSLLLFGEKLTPFLQGAILSFYEHKVAFQGFIWNINSFDQEGVQLGKRVATAILNKFSEKDSKSTSPLIGEAYLDLL